MSSSHFDKNGTHYVFGYRTKHGFAFVPHRFHVHTDGDVIRGQFLSSQWFSVEHSRTEVQDYIIIGLQGSFRYSELTDAVNKAYKSGDKLWYNGIKYPDDNHRDVKYGFGDNGEKYPDIVFCDKFSVEMEETERLVESKKLEVSAINIDGSSGKSKLYLSARRYGELVYVTLPDFEINNK